MGKILNYFKNLDNYKKIIIFIVVIIICAVIGTLIYKFRNFLDDPLSSLVSFATSALADVIGSLGSCTNCDNVRDSAGKLQSPMEACPPNGKPFINAKCFLGIGVLVGLVIGAISLLAPKTNYEKQIESKTGKSSTGFIEKLKVMRERIIKSYSKSDIEKVKEDLSKEKNVDKSKISQKEIENRINQTETVNQLTKQVFQDPSLKNDSGVINSTKDVTNKIMERGNWPTPVKDKINMNFDSLIEYVKTKPQTLPPTTAWNVTDSAANISRTSDDAALRPSDDEETRRILDDEGNTTNKKIKK